MTINIHFVCMFLFVLEIIIPIAVVSLALCDSCVSLSLARMHVSIQCIVVKFMCKPWINQSQLFTAERLQIDSIFSRCVSKVHFCWHCQFSHIHFFSPCCDLLLLIKHYLLQWIHLCTHAPLLILIIYLYSIRPKIECDYCYGDHFFFTSNCVHNSFKKRQVLTSFCQSEFYVILIQIGTGF